MTILSIDLDPGTDKRLENEASRRGIDKGSLARQIIESRLPPLSDKQRSAVELLQSWLDEDATDDPAERRARESEWSDFERDLNDSAGRVIFP
jgi:hypothetical protein